MIDHYLGELLNRLQKEGIEENTLVIFTSDNGCSPAAGIEELQEQGHYPSYIYKGPQRQISLKADIEYRLWLNGLP